MENKAQAENNIRCSVLCVFHRIFHGEYGKGCYPREWSE